MELILVAWIIHHVVVFVVKNYIIYRNIEKDNLFKILTLTQELPDTEKPFVKEGCLCFKEKNKR